MIRQHPRAPSVPPEHQEIVERVTLEHRVSELEKREHKRDEAWHRKVALLQWVVGGVAGFLLLCGGGLVKYAYDGYSLLANRVIAVEKYSADRAIAVEKYATDRIDAAIRDGVNATATLTIQVARLDERLASMQERMGEPGRSASAGSRRAGTR